MNKDVLAAASYYKRKYFKNPDYEPLPSAVRDDIKVFCTSLSEKIRGVCVIGFYEDGRLYIEAQGEADDPDYDEELAKSEIEISKTTQRELLHALQLWYAAFKGRI